MMKLVDAEKLMDLVNKDAAELAKQLPYRDHAPYVLAALRLKRILNDMDDGVIRCKDCKEACVKGNTTHDGRYLYEAIRNMSYAQPTLYGYNIEHLELIARVLQKEDLPPERVVEVLTDIGRIVAIVKDEFEEALRRSVRNIERRADDER